MSTEPSHPYEILDVFTDTPLRGNALAVFTEAESIPSRLMQTTARELHLSETVFLLPGDEEADAQVRIFTPAAELPFAGHPVLGAAFVVGTRHELATVRLRTPSGIVPVTLTRDHGEVVHGEMEQPLPQVTAYDRPDDVLAALGLDRAALPMEIYSNGPRHVMVALDSAAAVSAIEPDEHALRALGPVGVVCLAREDAQDEALNVRARVFHVALGVPEDPATGSAAGPLALHLVRHGWLAPGQTVRITQGVEIERHSTLLARVEGTPEQPQRVLVAGSAVLVARGHFRLQ